jgi:hypothetical protein
MKLLILLNAEPINTTVAIANQTTMSIIMKNFIIEINFLHYFCNKELSISFIQGSASIAPIFVQTRAPTLFAKVTISRSCSKSL